MIRTALLAVLLATPVFAQTREVDLRRPVDGSTLASISMRRHREDQRNRATPVLQCEAAQRT